MDAKETELLLNLYKNAVDLNKPDLILGPLENPYTKRWHIVKNKSGISVLLLNICGPDPDRFPHNHPSDSVSILLQGSYIEEIYNVETGTSHFIHRNVGDVVHRDARTFHRISIFQGQDVWSLFTMGNEYNDWGWINPETKKFTSWDSLKTTTGE